MGIFNHLGIRFREIELNTEKPDVLLERFKDKMKEGSSKLEMQIAYHSVFIKVPRKMHKWWSPELTVNIEEHENGSLIRKVTGPNPGTFTLAMFFITSAITFFIFALMFAFSQIQLNLSPMISLLVTLACAAVAIIVIAILGWGRKKAHPQISIMNKFVHEIMKN